MAGAVSSFEKIGRFGALRCSRLLLPNECPKILSVSLSSRLLAAVVVNGYGEMTSKTV